MTDESNFVSWARDELRRAGLFDEDADYGGMLGEEVMRMVETFDEAGHSGFSAQMAASIFARLSAWKPLTPISDDPDEWMHIDEDMAGDATTWQSRRSPSLFSCDGGKRYYDIDERRSWWRRHIIRRPRMHKAVSA
jgi:hypothetical protein